jgi:PAS domain S-box-containing protein
VERDEQGNPVRIVGTTLDITDRKRAEQALLSAHNELERRVEERTAELKRSEEKYRALFEESLDAVYITTRGGRLVDANQAFLDLFGLTREEAKDMDILKIYTDDADRRRFQQEIERNGSVRDYEVSFRKKDGTRIEGLLTSSVRRDTDGTILGYQGIMRDVTERRMLERQLLQAQKMEAVGTLAGGIAHDFNNLLQVTMGYAEVLLSRKDKADSEYPRLQQILQAGRSGSELVQRLLTLSRKTESKQRPIDVNYQIEQARRLLERTIPKMIEIELRLAASLATANADPTQLEQIIMNLAVNARDAMPEGGKLTLGTENVTLDEDYCRRHPGAKPGNYVLLAISDTGFGMDKEILDHIFEPFFTTKGVGMGTGLGLAVVYGIVKQHGGYVTCESQPGHGTVFKVYLPAIEEQEIVSGELAEELRLPGGTETILLVEDEEVVRDLGELILCESGYRVLTAKNGKEALTIYQRNRESISLVILDLVMPEMGGKQCFEELLKIDPRVKVLIASGLSVDGSTKEALEGVARGFASKPYNMKEMLRSVRKVLDET